MLTLRLGKVRATGVSFGYCPAQEALHSLFVLLHAKRFPLHIRWAVRARKQISTTLKAEIEAFRFFFHDGMPIIWSITGSQQLEPFADQLAEFRGRPASDFSGLVCRFAAGNSIPTAACDSSPDREQLLGQVEAHWPDQVGVVRQALDDPEACRDRFASMLETYWAACIEPEWGEIEQAFARDIERRGRLLFRRGLVAALEEASPELRTDPGSASCFVGRSSGERELILTEEARVWLMPSWFAWPHTFIHPDPRNLIISYPVLGQQEAGRAPVPPERLLKLLRAAGDMTRLQILQLLRQRERSTTELAGLIGISEAAVSKHLKQLHDAGLVEPERQSYYVFYRLVPEGLLAIGHGVESALAPPAPL